MLTENRLDADLAWVKDLRLEKMRAAYSTPTGALFQIDAIKLLSALPTDSVDLVLTSPPFALTRKKEYGNESLERYIAWFMPFCAQIRRVLKSTGSFVLDIGGAIPPNLITIANTESNSAYLRVCRERGIKPHPARYPEQLAKFFIDFLTDKGDLVVDPFAGSNVTGAVCNQHGRRWLATEIESKYVEGSMIRFECGPLFDQVKPRRKSPAKGLVRRQPI